MAVLLGRARLHELEDLYGEQTALALVDYRRVLEIDEQNQTALDGVERLAPPTARPE